MVSLFFDLPIHLQKCLLSEWLKPNEIVRLDSAMCSKRFRSEFLNMMKNLTVNTSDNFKLSRGICWLSGKGLKCSYISVTKSNWQITLQQYPNIILDQTYICIEQEENNHIVSLNR